MQGGFASLIHPIVTRSQILRLFGQHGLQDLFRTHHANALGNPPLDNDEEDDGYTGRGSRRRRQGRPVPSRYPPIPSEEGRRLMSSGTFGETGFYEDKLRKRKDRLARRLIYRELGVNQDPPARANKLISQVEYSMRCWHSKLMPFTFRVSYLLQTRTPSSITMLVVTLASSLTMATSSSAVGKTSKFECTTPQILTSGNTTRLPNIPTDNGRSQMPP